MVAGGPVVVAGDADDVEQGIRRDLSPALQPTRLSCAGRVKPRVTGPVCQSRPAEVVGVRSGVPGVWTVEASIPIELCQTFVW